MKTITRCLWMPGLFAMSLISTGCTSIRSTFYDPIKPCQTCDQDHYRGVPTTIEVPRWIKIAILESRYLPTGQSAVLAAVSKPGQKTLDFTTRSVEYDFLRKKELFTVDPKRPMAGSLDYMFGFGTADGKDEGDKQNITNYSYDVNDRTIEQISMTVTNMISRYNALRSAQAASKTEGGAPPPSNLTQITTTMAVRIFDLAKPGVEREIQEFLECHVNRFDATCVQGAAK